MSDSTPKPDNLFEQLLKAQTEDEAGLPPVDTWHPDLSGDMDMRIARDGSWYHEGGLIKRSSMVGLFSSILVREGNDFFLVTPAEKWRIQVDDAPFVIVAVDVENPGEQQALVFTTNVGSTVVAGRDNLLWVETSTDNKQPSPYINVRKNLHALISRNVFYELAELAVEQKIDDKIVMGVWSLGEFYVLGEE